MRKIPGVRSPAGRGRGAGTANPPGRQARGVAGPGRRCRWGGGLRAKRGERRAQGADAGGAAGCGRGAGRRTHPGGKVRRAAGPGAGHGTAGRRAAGATEEKSLGVYWDAVHRAGTHRRAAARSILARLRPASAGPPGLITGRSGLVPFPQDFLECLSNEALLRSSRAARRTAARRTANSPGQRPVPGEGQIRAGDKLWQSGAGTPGSLWHPCRRDDS